MAIKSKYSGSRISTPGEYVVHVIEVNNKLSKKGDPMMVVTYETDDERKISDYFVHKYEQAVIKLKDCMQCAGLPEGSKATQLVGKTLGILVEEGAVNERGGVFMQITGYDTAAKVFESRTNAAAGVTGPTEFAQVPSDSDDLSPF